MAASNLFLALLLAATMLVCNAHGLPEPDGISGQQLEDSNVETANGLGSDQRRSWQEFVDEVPKEDEELSAGGEKLEQRSSQSEQSRAEEIKILKALVEQQQQLLETQKKAMETQKADLQSVMQQVDSLVLQDAKTLKLIGSQSNKDEVLSVGTYSSVSSRTACHAPVRSNQIMIPARRECPLGWTMEYRGYLVSNFGGGYVRGEYICVDEEPETKVAGHLTQYGMWLAPVRAQCGSLSCPKYVNGRQIACIVCTK